MTPARADPFQDQTPAAGSRDYAEVMKEHNLLREEAAVKRNVEKKKKEMEEQKRSGILPKSVAADASSSSSSSAAGQRKRTRWDATPAGVPAPSPSATGSKWDQTPAAKGETVCNLNCNIHAIVIVGASAWDATPRAAGAADATPGGVKRSRWDVTPANPGTMLAMMNRY